METTPDFTHCPETTALAGYLDLSLPSGESVRRLVRALRWAAGGLCLSVGSLLLLLGKMLAW